MRVTLSRRLKILFLKQANHFRLQLHVVLSIIFFLTGCNVEPELADVNVKNSDPRLVVEGLITDQPGPYLVKLSLSGKFASTDITRINDAVVVISDDLGNIDTLKNIDAGLYQTNIIKGEVGHSYILTVIYNGEVYTASSFLPGGIDIDSLGYTFLEESLIYDEGYYPILYGRENADEENYYRWYLYENDTVDKMIMLEEDALYNPEIKELIIDRQYDKNDIVKVEVHSIGKREYLYYLGLLNVIDNDGGFFSAPPKNPEGNVSNGALGIFRASKVSTASIQIKE